MTTPSTAGRGGNGCGLAGGSEEGGGGMSEVRERRNVWAGVWEWGV